MHGGAAIINQTTRDYMTPVRQLRHAEEKARIGAAAAELIVDGDAVLIDSGTTTLEVTKHLAGRSSLTFITNGTDVLAELAAAGAQRLHFIGGEYIEVNRSLGGPMAADMVRRFSVDKAILSVTAVDLERGVIATTSPQISAVQQAMIEIAGTVIVVADNSKFGRNALSVVAPLSAVDYLVTDTASEAHVEHLPETIRQKFIFA